MKYYIYQLCEFRNYIKTKIMQFRVSLIRKIAGCDHIVIGVGVNGIEIKGGHGALIADCYVFPQPKKGVN